jgi:hypothetical protein
MKGYRVYIDPKIHNNLLNRDVMFLKSTILGEILDLKQPQDIFENLITQGVWQTTQLAPTKHQFNHSSYYTKCYKFSSCNTSPHPTK